jgi:DNA-binding transcriptional ArsR family regulator
VADSRVEIRDAAVMRALAHPARIKIVDHLFAGNVGTATELAEVCGLSPSATSYHLRALAKANLIEEAPSRGDGRERVWMTSAKGLSIVAGPEATPAERAAEAELAGMYMDRDEARLRAWFARRESETQQWYDASAISSMRVKVTLEELEELNRQVDQLFRAYQQNRRTDAPEDARLVYVLYRAFPAET